MNPPARSASFVQTVTCSSCAADIPLAALADHVCVNNYNNDRPMVQDQSQMPPYSMYPDQRPQGHPIIAKSSRPVLPRLDSSVSARSGLHPNEAANIAHDLGLPSPLSAGGSGRKSPGRPSSRHRKASAPRPPSNDLPLSQDCAFPPFPMKPKRSQTDKPRSSSRTAQHPKPLEKGSVHSSSSSVFSAGGPPRRRTSNTSSEQRSRQGTIDSMSIPSTASSSPRQSSFAIPLSREHSFDQPGPMPTLMEGETNSVSEPMSAVSAGMPPTPSWPLEIRPSNPTIATSPPLEDDHRSMEENIGQQMVPEPKKVVQFKPEPDSSETFDAIMSREQLRTSVDMFDNPPREPFYKAKRPPPLMQPQRRATEDIAGPLSARPAPNASGGGLTRTLTNLFSRKRSQSASSKKMPLPSLDSPRMRALAPEVPDIPSRVDNSWEDVPAGDDTREHAESPPEVDQEQSLPPRQDSIAKVASPEPITDDYSDQAAEHDDDRSDAVRFDFKFDNTSNSVQAETIDADAENDSNQHTSIEPSSTDFTDAQHEQHVNRASVDSASSYGSVGFSNRTMSSRSSLPPSDDMRRKISAALDSDQPPPPPSAPASIIEQSVPARLRTNDLVPDSPTDPLYHQGTLSPVPDEPASRWASAAEAEAEAEMIHQPALETESEPQFEAETDREPQFEAEIEQAPPSSPEKALLPPMPEMDRPEETRIERPTTPAGNKGRCKGCANLIKAGQKSVASADGRLTGRYHKECFVCRTCKEAFSTADFYVYNDQPYCAHHYHVVNDTLCAGCGLGIEGQVLETADVTGAGSKKFHSKCLQCFTCRVQLNDDYFEFHGRVYCERDAFRAANGPRSPYDTVPARPSPLVREYINSGEPRLKGRFPERRTTRLIMT